MLMREDAKRFFILGITVALLNIVVPFLVLKKIGSSWINYLFWVILTLAVISIGLYHMRGWGEET